MLVKYKEPRSLLGTIFHVEILQGMALTLRRLFSKPITRQYPTEKIPIQNGFRGQQALVRDPVTGSSKCVACMRCAEVCPSRCIHIRFHEEDGCRYVDSYDIEALRCVYCGYCQEVCPVNALVLTEVFEYGDYNRQAFDYSQEDLLANWDRFVRECNIDEETYVNPFWRPRGMQEELLTAAKRMDVPAEWTVEGQVLGKNYKRDRRSIA